MDKALAGARAAAWESADMWDSLIDLQTEYVPDVFAAAGAAALYPNTAATAEIWKDWVRSKNAGLDTYRNKGGYRSVFTGLVSVPRRTPWMSEKNDSLDALMREMGDEAPG